MLRFLILRARVPERESRRVRTLAAVLGGASSSPKLLGRYPHFICQEIEALGGRNPVPQATLWLVLADSDCKA